MIENMSKCLEMVNWIKIKINKLDLYEHKFYVITSSLLGLK